MNISYIIALFLIGIISCFTTFQCVASQSTLKVGDMAPDFTLQDQNGEKHSVSAMRGKKLVLFFYPKDSSPGCSKEACSIRDNFAQLEDAEITVWGISVGDLQSKKHFADRFNLSFPLLISTQQVLDAYGVSGSIWRLYLPKRYTYFIDENGRIVAIIKNVDINRHAQQILDAFSNK